MARYSVMFRNRAFLILIGLAALSGSAVAIGNFKAAITMGRAGSWVSATGGYPSVEGMLNENGTPTWHYDGGTELPMVPTQMGVTAGTYTNAAITVDKYSRITSIAPGAAPGGGYNSILSNGGAVTARGTANMVGSGVSCADNSGSARTDCTFTPLSWFNVLDYGATGNCASVDDTTAIRATVAAAVVNGGTVYFPTTVKVSGVAQPACYKITSQIDVASYYPVNLVSDMYGWRDSSTTGSFITPGANFGTSSTTGNLFRYISPTGTGHTALNGGGMVRGLSFRDNFTTADTGGHYTMYAALYLYDFTEGSVQDCAFHDLNGSAIAADMVVKGNMSNIVAIYTGSATRPAISLEGVDTLHTVQNTSLEHLRIETSYGTYLQLGQYTSSVRVSDIGMEADTTNALTCNTMVLNQGNNNIFANVNLNRDSAAQWNDSGNRTQVTNLMVLDDSTKTSNASVLVSGSENEYHNIQVRGAISSTASQVRLTGTLNRFYGIDLAFCGGLSMTTGSLNQIFGVSTTSLVSASTAYAIDISAANSTLDGCILLTPPANMGGVRITGSAGRAIVSNCTVRGVTGTGIAFRDENANAGTIFVVDASDGNSTDFSNTSSTYTAIATIGIPVPLVTANNFKVASGANYDCVGANCVMVVGGNAAQTYFDSWEIVSHTLSPQSDLANTLGFSNLRPSIVYQGYHSEATGADVASATTITPTGGLFRVSGTTAIATINVPTVCAATGNSCCIDIVPTGIFTTTTAGNIALASTAVVGKLMHDCYSNATSKWYPSY